MKRNFFITGLPRSRTSWLANFFTYNNTFCFHEATRFCASIEDLKITLANHDASNIGNADPALIYMMDDLVNMFPEAKFLFVEREVYETIDSFLGFYASLDSQQKVTDWILQMNELFQKAKQKYNVMTISHNELNQMDACKQTWEYLVPEIPFDEKRWKMLDELYINKLPYKHSEHAIRNSLYSQFIQYF